MAFQQGKLILWHEQHHGNIVFLLLQLTMLYTASIMLIVHGKIKQLLFHYGNAVWNHVALHTGFQMISAGYVFITAKQ